jgi:hypothetical protein
MVANHPIGGARTTLLAWGLTGPPPMAIGGFGWPVWGGFRPTVVVGGGRPPLVF